MTLRIKDVADRTGFSPPTLRYYEQIGLLPESARTAAGYRTYDEDTVDRLAFIARAKQLGCTLDEIADLTTAWEGGRCGPIQDRLRSVVADKLTAAEARIVELATLSNELRRAATSLELHRPDGPCDDRCGCVGDADPTTTSSVSMSSKPTAPQPVPIACTLRADALRGRLEDWRALLDHATRRLPLAGGVRVELAADTPIAEVAALVAAEQDCCQFLHFAITVDTRGLALEVTGREDAASIIETVFGAAS